MAGASASQRLYLCLLAACGLVSQGLECYDKCAAFMKEKADKWELGVCCDWEGDYSECCEADGVAIVLGGIAITLAFVGILLLSCGLCGCCPWYTCLPFSKCGVGCCIPSKLQAGGGQSVEPAVVAGQPVANT